MGLRIAQFLAIVLTAIALVPAGAHFFELPNKIDLPQEAYFTVQSIYRGWALFGVVLFGALVANLALTFMARHRRGAFWLALLAFLLVAGTLAVFFTWTYPANQATANWTDVPANWQELRRQWEYAHATNAILTFLALCAATLSTLLARDPTAEQASRPRFDAVGAKPERPPLEPVGLRSAKPRSSASAKRPGQLRYASPRSGQQPLTQLASPSNAMVRPLSGT